MRAASLRASQSRDCMAEDVCFLVALRPVAGCVPIGLDGMGWRSAWRSLFPVGMEMFGVLPKHGVFVLYDPTN